MKAGKDDTYFKGEMTIYYTHISCQLVVNERKNEESEHKN